MAASQHITDSGLILAGRRNFLVRAIGLAALPLTAAPAAIATAPHISADLIEKMQKWKGIHVEYETLFRDHEGHRVRFHEGPAKLTMEGRRYYALCEARSAAHSAMLAAICADL